MGILKSPCSCGDRPRSQAVSVPLTVQGEVRYVLYADNAPLGRPIGPLDTAIADTVATADTARWSAGEIAQFESVVDVVPVVT